MHSPRLSIAPTFDVDELTTGIQASADPTWLSWAEFGPRIAIDRILHLLSRREWQVTWFVPGHAIDAFGDVCRRIVDAGHEIAHHGYLHEDLTRLDEAAERAVIERGIEVITRLTGQRPVGFRTPYWKPSSRTHELLVEYGFVYDASLMADDFSPYYYKARPPLDTMNPVRPLHEARPTSLVEVPVSWALEDLGQFENPTTGGGPMRRPREVAELWDDEIQFAYERIPNAVAVLTLHPECIGRGARLSMLERLLDRWADLDGAQIVRLDQFVAAWEQREEKEPVGS